MMRKSILEAVHGTAKGLYDAGVIDAITMKKYDTLCLPEIKKFTSKQIKKIRLREKVSQPIFAEYLNISPSTVKQWESGSNHPGGAALKLLNLVANKGLTAII